MQSDEQRLRSELERAALMVSAGPSLETRIEALRARARTSTPSRRRWLPVAAAIGVVAAVAAVIVWNAASAPDRLEVSPPVQKGDHEQPPDDAGHGWSRIQRAPLSERAGAGAVWAGDRLVVWSGRAVGADRPPADDYLTDGASWRPGVGWTAMSAAPEDLGLMPGGSAIWTGSEVVFWPVHLASAEFRENAYASPTMLAYDPTEDSWREVPVEGLRESGIQPYAPYRAVAVDGKVVIAMVGRPDNEFPPGTVAVIDPSTGDTRKLPPGPFNSSPYEDNSGDVLLSEVSGALVATPNWALESWVLSDLSSGEWKQAPAPPVAPTLHLDSSVGVGGSALYLEDSDPVALDVHRLTWTAVDPGPVGHGVRVEVESHFLSTGTSALSVGAQYDPASGRWSQLPDLPVPDDLVLSEPYLGWTGSALVVFGGGRYQCPRDAICDSTAVPAIDGWVYRP